jgi:hypothetical protein
MRWGVAIATVLMLIGSVFADDTTNIGKTLTPDEAEEEIRYAGDWNDPYRSLKGVASLTPEVAAILAKHKVKSLSLPDLTLLTPDVAAALSAYKGELALDSLEQLSAETAQALAKHEGRLSLNSITYLADNAALALAEHKGGLCMGGLRELRSEPLARQLLLTDNSFSVGGDGGLNPDALTEISPEVAELLVIKEQDRDGLSLPELKSPSIDVLRVLVRLNGSLHLGITSLPQDMAQVLSVHSDYLDLSGVEDIDKASLVAVLRKEGGLALSLAVISPDTAALLAGFRGDLVLNNERLPKEAELLLAKSEANSLMLPNLKELKTAEFTRRLVESRATNGRFDFAWPRAAKGDWDLAIETVSLDIVEQLKAFRGVLKLPAIDRVSSEVADTLSECEGHLILPALRELTSGKLAKKLAETATSGYATGESDDEWDVRGCPGLRLPRLTRVDADIARALASHNGDRLALNGLVAVTDEVAEALATFTGDLSLKGITELSARSEQLLGLGRCKHISVPQLRRLTDGGFAKKAILNEIESASVDALQELVEKNGTGANPGSIYLKLRELTPEQAAALAKRHGGFGDILFLDSVQRLDAVTASELAKARLGISLCGLREITPEVAAAFASHREAIYLMGVEKVPVELARVLAEKKSGWIFFDGRYDFRSGNTPLELPEESAAILQKNPQVKLPRYLRP